MSYVTIASNSVIQPTKLAIKFTTKKKSLGKAGCALFLTLTAVGLLAGCMTVGPDYERPQTALPEAWGGVVTASEAAPDLAEWWRVFDDPVLDNLMVCAQTNNLDVRQAEARLRQARAQRLLASANRRPSLDASAFSLAQEQYAAGLTDFQSVLTSQQSLLTTQNSLTLSHAEVASATIRLYKALGGGWSAAAELVG